MSRHLCRLLVVATVLCTAAPTLCMGQSGPEQSLPLGRGAELPPPLARKASAIEELWWVVLLAGQQCRSKR